jgi:L-lactate dehydrogenase complex protein LldF
MTTGHDILFPRLPYDMHARAKAATHNVQLQQFVNHATLSKDIARKKIMADAFGDRVDAMRSLAGSIKQHTLNHLDHYLDQFVANAVQAGAQVHFAADAATANAIAVDIAQRHGCKLCVKSKSMVTEETQLVPALQAIGCETVETDLGEYIIQIDHDAPSHIVTPMIHKDRAAVARAFVRELGAPYTEDAQQLTQIARGHLRQKYRQADLGISGANFLIAETGSLVICTNEGNGRFCTSAPPIHIAFVGIEKLLPKLEHLSVLLKLLARSSTGQPLTVYTHLMTGPRRAHEPDGPRQMHIVLVDNGRTNVLKPDTREMLRCIRCGACLNACPVYRKVGGHAYGSVYSGPIGAILTPVFKGLGNYGDLPNASSLCGACFEACPVKINIPHFLIHLRNDMVTRRLTKRSDRLFMRLWAWSLTHGFTYRLGGWMQKVMFRAQAKMTGNLPASGGDPYHQRGWVSKLPGPVAGWTNERDMPTPPARSFRAWWRSRQRDAKGEERGAKGEERRARGEGRGARSEE